VIRDELNEIQTIIEGSKKIEIIELIDDDDVVMEEKNDDVIEIDQFPPNKQSKDFFELLSQPNFQPLSDKIKQEKLKLAFDLSKKLTICHMCKDSFCLYDAISSINCVFCAGICNNSTCELKHIGTNCAKSQCYGIEFE
jgi:hypothetical protein